MAAIAYDKKLIRPYTDVGWVYPPLEAGEAMNLGNAVTMQTDGTVDESGAAEEDALGIVVSVVAGTSLDGNVVSGEKVGVLAFGLVSGFSGLTPGASIYLGANGELQDTGTVRVGFAFKSTIAMFHFVRPTVDAA